MAESHVCMFCGLDLARIRAVVEPRYGLPVVACPDCRTVAVRRRHPIVARWRQTVRMVAALRAMLLRVVAAAALMGASVVVVLMLEEEAEWRGQAVIEFPAALLRGDPSWISQDDWLAVGLFLLAWIGVQLGVGVLLSVGFGHWWPRILAWGGWAAVLVLLLSISPVWYVFEGLMGWVLRDPVVYDGPGWGACAMRATVGLGAMLAAPLGVPLGRGLTWAGGQWRRMKFRARRRRRRLDRGFGG